ncbi:MAG TPA: hypothetical protein VHE78_09395 [Gemmatimonadaceae bacterium]|nr:hypothetical protein [Gemmatimonadaceae bacterium]
MDVSNSLNRMTALAVAFMTLTARGAAQDVASDSIAINRLRSRLVSAFRSNTADSLAPVVADDFVFAGTPAVNRRAFVALFKTPFDSAKAANLPNPFALYPSTIHIEGDWAFERGRFGPDGGPPVGTYTWVYHRTGTGFWELAYWGRGGALRQ